MAADLEVYLELERRKALSPEQIEILNELRRRDVIKQRATGTQPPQPFVPTPEPSMGAALPPAYEPPISRGTMVGVGGGAGSMLGGVSGAAAGGVGAIPGTLAGGALGAAAGSSLYDFSRNLSHALMPSKVPPGPGIEKQVTEAGKAAYEDVLWSMGGMAAGPAIKGTVKPVIGKAMGVFNPAAKKMFDTARQFGVNLGASHVSPRKWVRGVPRVLGVFPFVGTPFRKGQAEVVGELNKASADLLNTLAPTSTMFESAQGMTKAAARRFKHNARIGAALYENFYGLTEQLPVKEIVPSAPIKEALGEIATRAARETTELTTGRVLSKTTPDPVGEFIKQLNDLPDRISVGSARGIERMLNEIISEGAKQGWDVSRLATVKHGLEAAKNAAVDPANLKALGVSDEMAAGVMNSWKKANSFWGKMMGTFESATAQKFGKADRNIFNKAVWKPGSKEADEIYRDVFSTKSLDALQNLREIVGPKEFRRASRVYLDNAIDASRITAKEGALVDNLFSAAKFEKQIGLDTKEGRALVEEMLKGSGMSIKTLDKFVEVAKRATDIAIVDPSSFLARRIILAGGAGAAGGVMIGANRMSISGAVLTTLGLRQGAKFLMSPKQLERMTRIMSDSTTDKMRRVLLTKFFMSLDEGAPEVMN